MVKIIEKHKKIIHKEEKYINWDISECFESIFDSENFMLCVRYPQNYNVNYIKMDPLVSKGYDDLFLIKLFNPKLLSKQ